MAGNRKQPNVVRLSVHRNTREQRRLHAVSDDMRRAVAAHTHKKHVEGYALVSWNTDGEITTSWDAGEIKMNLLPHYVATSLQREISMCDIRRAVGSPPENPGDDTPA